MTVFARLLHAEWTKFRTVRGWVAAVLIAFFATVLVGLLGTGGTKLPHGPVPPLPTGPGGEAVSDAFFFVHRTLSGDGSLTVRLASLTGADGAGAMPWAKGGILVKAGTRPGSSYAAVLLTGAHGTRMQHDFTHDRAGRPGSGPRWLRLVRTGALVTGSESADGVRWTTIGTARVRSGVVETGMFATSPASFRTSGRSVTENPAVATAVFDHVDARGAFGGAWRDEQLGGDPYGPGMRAEMRPGLRTAGGTFTLTGAGDIAPLVGGPALGNAFPVEAFLVGAFAGLIALAVLGATAMTAEYRRGMIRTTLAASPHPGRVLAAKAVVLGAVAFTVGTAAALVAVRVGEHRVRADGYAIFTVPALTEVRAVAGTGLLLAAAAILALGAGTVLRRGAVAVTGIVVLIVIPYILAMSAVLPSGAANWVLRVSPAAGFAVQQTLPRYGHVWSNYTPAAGYYPLAPWVGFAVLCGWAALAFGSAVILLRRRDA
ncbi:ABC-2 family transporter protein [Actinomadura rubteroloni]|uniref:ABC-2 family transporter protein n=1 Tax=Actinomadura rubteroloni TaxID=1926885 RepID=A0A2P4UGS3_9ACTN|nr:ABC transporter permease subunit [Actinomadura rubteroloni]POM24257.1 ABC-2 family transporter protein [Actinomadura rubteroloni]